MDEDLVVSAMYFPPLKGLTPISPFVHTSVRRVETTEEVAVVDLVLGDRRRARDARMNGEG